MLLPPTGSVPTLIQELAKAIRFYNNQMCCCHTIHKPFYQVPAGFDRFTSEWNTMLQVGFSIASTMLSGKGSAKVGHFPGRWVLQSDRTWLWASVDVCVVFRKCLQRTERRALRRDVASIWVVFSALCDRWSGSVTAYLSSATGGENTGR